MVSLMGSLDNFLPSIYIPFIILSIKLTHCIVIELHFLPSIYIPFITITI